MTVVACVLKSGGLYKADWVAKLQRGVARYLPAPHRFVCLSDVDVPCERIPLETNWRGWWSKLELFRPGLFGDETVLYFDLDTVVVGSLERIAAHPHRFTMAHEYNRPTMLCSTAMAWRGDYSFVYHSFARDPERFAQTYDKVLPNGGVGDQAFIEDCFVGRDRPDTFRDLFGERSIASYKIHNCQDAPPSDAAAVAFHGAPKPHELHTGWVAAAWK